MSENLSDRSFGRDWIGESGERVSNAQITYPRVRDNPLKGRLIPNVFRKTSVLRNKDLSLREGSVSY